MDSYRIPTKSGASEYVDKRSRFLGLVRPVGSEDEARTIIAACKKQYHDARHNCWCYLLRDGTERYSDDGEPQGTAGIPMLEVFRRAGVTNVVCVVTRYFGGVLLGTGGLLRAYTAAAADALADAGISEVRRWLACEVSTPYALYEPVRAAVAALGGVVQETQYAAAVTVCALLPEEAGEAFAAQVRSLGTSGEYFLVGGIVNTLLDAFDGTEVMLTVNGAPLESGHNIYDYALTRYEE